ncbi:hypothetical protein [Paracraurococcus lichenis]|uniref:Uncharacterized protein n=1 Tax=Paracraurococcus lichenis TaxID=3064888 RepID=A0ABT9DXZ8_9PROT|nr:hypothetical protein [Paracraurococcus sp. LOR1-02]MDO9708785.1 hypothetical protein [Paracraurococcus sp. LOR1-02]
MAVAESLSWLARFEAGKYKPVTFLERGVALPFTTPALMGGRIRPGERKLPELVLANPAGVEGVYILPWAGLPDVCTPTLHDRALWSRVAQLPILTPRAVRQATRSVAAEGLAGRAAARAAAEAEKATRDACTYTHYFLLIELVRQGDPHGKGAPLRQGDLEALEQRARAVLVERRGDSGISATAAFEALAELATVFEPCGLPGNPTQARLPALDAEITAVIQELGRWAEMGGPSERSCIRLLAEGAQITQHCFRQSLKEAHALLEDLWALVQRWRVAPAAISDIAARPEWLLDGWELICGLWRAAEEGHRGAALLDMAALVPIMPAEVGEWLGTDMPGLLEVHRSGLRHWRRTVQPNQDWMTGRLLDTTARTEALRARCA